MLSLVIFNAEFLNEQQNNHYHCPNQTDHAISDVPVNRFVSAKRKK